MKRNFCFDVTFLTLIAPLGFGPRVLEKKAAAEAAAVQVTMIGADPMWPKSSK